MYFENKEITIEVTNKCAAKCIMCPRDKMIQPLEVMSQSLYEKIEEIVARIGFGMSIKSFKPHITLARFKDKSRPFSQLIELDQPIESLINSLDVYESKFDSGQALHSLIKSYKFK